MLSLIVIVEGVKMLILMFWVYVIQAIVQGVIGSFPHEKSVMAQV